MPASMKIEDGITMETLLVFVVGSSAHMMPLVAGICRCIMVGIAQKTGFNGGVCVVPVLRSNGKKKQDSSGIVGLINDWVASKVPSEFGYENYMQMLSAALDGMEKEPAYVDEVSSLQPQLSILTDASGVSAPW